MAGQKSFIFDPQDLYNLLVHYTDGAVPLNGKVVVPLVNPLLMRMVGLLVESDEWTTPVPLHIRYDGKRIASWQQGAEPSAFQQKNETPRMRG